MTMLRERSTTFIFADLAGSDRLWSTTPAAVAPALDQYDAIRRAAVAANDGYSASPIIAISASALVEVATPRRRV